jgi:hypothetical protein
LGIRSCREKGIFIYQIKDPLIFIEMEVAASSLISNDEKNLHGSNSE